MSYFNACLGAEKYWPHQSFISIFPELGYITNKQASSLIEVAPIVKGNGRNKGKSIIQGGRTQVRAVMYMAMMFAIQCPPLRFIAALWGESRYESVSR